MFDKDPDDSAKNQGPRDAQELNRYSYVNNNPLRYADPDGHKKIDRNTDLEALLRALDNAIDEVANTRNWELVTMAAGVVVTGGFLGYIIAMGSLAHGVAKTASVATSTGVVSTGLGLGLAPDPKDTRDLLNTLRFIKIEVDYFQRSKDQSLDLQFVTNAKGQPYIVAWRTNSSGQKMRVNSARVSWRTVSRLPKLQR